MKKRITINGVPMRYAPDTARPYRLQGKAYKTGEAAAAAHKKITRGFIDDARAIMDGENKMRESWLKN